MLAPGSDPYQTGSEVMFSVIGLVALIHPSVEEGPLRFGRDVRPILSEHCFECHGPDGAQRQADLRLDVAESFGERRTSGLPLVRPGDVAGSELARRITHASADERMPPADFRHELDAEELSILLRWIEEGAEWEGHWAYQSIQEPSSDTVLAPGTIDAHLRRSWSVAGLEPQPRADRSTLVRRAALDLTGLPPSPEMLERVQGVDFDLAWGELVDELLASPHHAERLAQFWLDLVRYADTVGYHGDQAWRVWPYRDWVIESFEQNMPFDRFTVAQVAGDLLPGSTLEDKVASTYLRLNMVTFEGGSQPKEFLLKYQADRVRNVSGTWLGSTMGCAECHDHKFDPTTTRDFYSLAAFFADIQEQGVYTRFQDGSVPPEMRVPSAEDTARLASFDVRIEEVEARIAGVDLEAERAAWEEGIRSELQGPPADHVWLEDSPPQGARVEGAWRWEDAPDGPQGSRVRLQEGAGIVQHFYHQAPEALVSQEGDRFFLHVWLDPEDPPETVMLQVHSGNWDHRAYWGADRISFGGIGSDQPGHRHEGDLPLPGAWARLEVDGERIGLAAGAVVDGLAFTQFGGRARWGRAGVLTASPGLLAAGASPELGAMVRLPRGERDEEKLRALFADRAPSLAPLRAERDGLVADRSSFDDSIPRTLAVVSGAPRETRIRPRGNWMDDSGPVVQPDVPHFLPGLPPREGRATRLDLARWLVAPDNPLTARVFVNRVWRLFFGYGLSRSVDDSGLQGEAPDHPELLDRLARDFIDSGWDVRALVRSMVTSEAYLARSVARTSVDGLDPENRLFGRQERWRLDGEFVRDLALATSGLLNPEVGGASVKPYQPAGYWRELNFPRRTWQHDQGDSLYRRGMYTFWCRTFLHPTMKAFDAPAREECTARRGQSNTPLQALALLGDPGFVEAARVLAERVLMLDVAGDRERMEQLYRIVLARPCTAEELEILLPLVSSQLEHFAANPEEARLLAAAGEAPVAGELDPVHVAAWSGITRTVLNLGEAITRR